MFVLTTRQGRVLRISDPTTGWRRTRQTSPRWASMQGSETCQRVRRTRFRSPPEPDPDSRFRKLGLTAARAILPAPDSPQSAGQASPGQLKPETIRPQVTPLFSALRILVSGETQ